MVAKWRDDPSYSQETFHVFVLTALSNERGGNRDEVKNDIRAIPEVLTVTTVDPVDGGVQKQLEDYFLSTLKLRVRHPRGIDRDVLAQEIAGDINKMRGIAVRRHASELGKDLREEEEIQRAYKAGHARKKKKLVGTGGNKETGGGKGITRPSMNRSRSAPPMGEGKVKIKIRSTDELLSSFEVRPDLNREIWENSQMSSEVRERLVEIAEEFIEKLDLPNLQIKDIILTGSLANYNWSEYSDLDVHIVVDFKDVAEDEGLVKKYFDSVRANWNRSHDIKVKGYEVELYVQDDDEAHASTGIYSLIADQWVTKPEKKEGPIDKINIFKKARHITRDIEKVEKHVDRHDYEPALELGRLIKTKIKKMRSGGLERGGIYSIENLAFKVLRRSGFIGRLFNALGIAYDKQKSLAEQE